MRHVVFTGLIGGLLLWAGQAQPTRVAFQEPAQPVRQVIQTLSERTGERLRVSRELADEILLIEVADAPLETLLNAVAQALDARWLTDYDGARLLTRPVGLRQRRVRQERERLSQLLEQSLNQSLTQNLSTGWDEAALRKQLTVAREAMQRVIDTVPERTPPHRARDLPEVQQLVALVTEQLNPDGRLLWQIVQRLGVARLLDVPITERRVFGNLRGRFIEPIEFDLNPLLRQFLAERNLLTALWMDPEGGVHQTYEQLVQHIDIDLGAVRLRPFAPETLPLRRVDYAPEEILVLLEVGRYSITGFVLRLHLIGRDGALIGSTDWHLWADASRDALHRLETAQWLDAPVRWSESTQRVWRALQQVQQLFQQGGGDYEPPAEADPARVEPLSLAVADYLRARAQGKPFVAYLHDGLITYQFAFVSDAPLRERATLREHLSFVRAMEGELEFTEGAIAVVKPYWATHWWGKRLSRPELSRRIQQIRARGYLNLDDISALMRLTPTLCIDDVRALLRLNGIDEQYQMNASNRIWSVLTERTRALLEQNAPLTVGDLPPEERYALHYQVYLRWGGAMGFYEIRDAMPTTLMHYYLPDGLPLNARIALQTRQEAGVWSVRVGAVWNRFMSYNTARVISERTPEVSDEEDPNAPARLALQQPVPHGVRTELVLDVYLPSSLPFSRIQISDAVDYRKMSLAPRLWYERPAP